MKLCKAKANKATGSCSHAYCIASKAMLALAKANKATVCITARHCL